MPKKIPLIQLYLLFAIYVLLFFGASYLTSLITTDDFPTMIIFTITVTIYWFIAIAMSGLHKRSANIKQVHLKTVISIIIIMVVSTIQQLMFINIPFDASFTFFGISLVLLLLLHSLFFKSKFIR